MQPDLPNSDLKTLVLWLLRRRRRFRVVGHSMQPSLNPGEELLINPYAYGQKLPEPGDIVVARHPEQPELPIVKRVLFVEADGRCYLKGDNPEESTDSRRFGLVPPRFLMGQVISRFP
jgi:nickel-type superoxide dismutase maturation protease